MKQKILLLALLMPLILNAQVEFRPGFIIKEIGDTAFGEIDYRGDILMSAICRFKPDRQDEIIEYSPNDIISFRFIDSKYYISKEVNEEKMFLELLIEGQVNIYYMRDKEGDHYFIEKANEPMTEIPYEERYIIEESGLRYLYKSTKHIGIINHYMPDAPEFKNRIESIKKPGHRNLINLAKDYHNAVCKEKEYIIYEKKQPLIKANIEGILGVMNFADLNSEIQDNYYNQRGLLVHLWMPRINERLFFKTGFLYSDYEYFNKEEHPGKYGFLKIPTHIEYMTPASYKLRPFVSIGVLSPSYSAGLMVRVYKRVNIRVQSWANFYMYESFFLVPAKLANYSFLTSLYVEL